MPSGEGAPDPVATSGRPPVALARPASEPHHPIAPAALEQFLHRLGYRFVDPAMLGRALTHRSWCAEHAGFQSNERLEFLGDAVLGLLVTDDIYLRIPDASEGQLSRVRASVVCAPALAEMATELCIGPALLLGKGEAATGGRERPSILADAMEAVIGAVYLDGGMSEAQALVDRLVSPRLDAEGAPDHKSRLHELVAQTRQGRIAYRITEHGPEHDKVFEAVVLLDGAAVGAGSGRSKKSAEQGAAREAWLRLGPRTGADGPAREETDG